MGAEIFTTTAKGKTATEAFGTAQTDARYNYGHGGYTGSIAEKGGFRLYRTTRPVSQTEAYAISAKEAEWDSGKP